MKSRQPIPLHLSPVGRLPAPLLRTAVRARHARAYARPLDGVSIANAGAISSFDSNPAPAPAILARPRAQMERGAIPRVSRVSLLRDFTPEVLASFLEAFAQGDLGPASALWQKIRDQDDTVKAVVEKRELAVTGLPWEILVTDSSAEARRHKETLEDFYNGITATHALNESQRGGVSTLVRQMMHAQGHKWAVHEIIWTLNRRTAELRFVPLDYFENRTGALRYLSSGFRLHGEPLTPGEWMITTGAGLMEATSIACLFKSLPLKAWLKWTEKMGVPGLHGETTASPGSPAWDCFRDALANFSQDWALVTNPGSNVNVIEGSATGVAPHADLVDRMDRAISRLWRGNDLGTLSNRGGQSLGNASDPERLAEADAMLISETLQFHIDRLVIALHFGTRPRAYFQLQPIVRASAALELKVDDALIRWGVSRGKTQLLTQYGRSVPRVGEQLANASNDQGKDHP